MNLENRGKRSYATFLDQPDRRVEKSDEIDLRALFLTLWRGKWILLISILIFGAVGYLSSSQSAPSFRATAKVMFDQGRTNVVNLGQVVSGTEVRENRLQNQIEILRSTSLIERVVELEGLANNPEFNPRLRPPAPPTLMSQVRSMIRIPPAVREMLQDAGVLSPPPPPPPPLSAEELAERERQSAERERQIVIRNVLNRLDLRPVPDSRVIDISFVSGNPDTAARLANRVAEQYIVDQLEANLEATRTATEWLSVRVEELEARVQGAEDAVERARADLALEAGQSLEITQQQLSALNSALSATRNAATVARSTYLRLESAVREGRDFGAIPEFRASDLIRTYRAQEADLSRRRTTLAQTHPALRDVDAQLADVRAGIDAEVSHIVEAARAQWVSQEEQLEGLEEDVRELEVKALEQSRRQVTLRQLEREAQARRALYENFLGRLTEIAEQEELQTAGARILSFAERPLGAMVETGQRTRLLFTMIGIFVGLAIILVREVFNNSYRSARQLEMMTGEPVLGSIPQIGRRMRRRHVLKHFRDKPKSSLAEAVRSLRTSILFSNIDNPPHVVMFTSSVPREGKSTTSMLMALTSHQMGKSAIIVDCDLRLPALARLLNANDSQPGLLSVIAGKATLEEAIYRDPETGLHVLMTKRFEPRSSLNAADVLSSNRFRDLIQQLKDTYDLVIIDTPPTLVVADARILSALADAVVHVVRWNHTPRGAVIEGLKELRAVNAPIVGTVLSLVNEARASRYAYEGYGYNRAKYKDYYVS